MQSEKLKLVFAGDTYSGKTQFAQRLVNNVMIEEYKHTIGIDIFNKIVNYNNGSSEFEFDIAFHDIGEHCNCFL